MVEPCREMAFVGCRPNRCPGSWADQKLMSVEPEQMGKWPLKWSMAASEEWDSLIWKRELSVFPFQVELGAGNV
jgi:hypothetical protein